MDLETPPQAAAPNRATQTRIPSTPTDRGLALVYHREAESIASPVNERRMLEINA